MKRLQKKVKKGNMFLAQWKCLEPGQDRKIAALIFYYHVRLFYGVITMREKYMQIALEEARKGATEGEIPIGAVIVWRDRVIAKAHNLKEKKHSAIKHAELIAIAKANQKLKDWRLSECELYVTLMPCSMCASAIQQSRFKKVYYGTPTTDEKERELVLQIFEQNQSETTIPVEGGILEAECREVLQNFFKNRRKKHLSL